MRAIQSFFIVSVFNFNKNIEIDFRANYIFNRNNNAFVLYFNTMIVFCFFIDFNALRFLVKSNKSTINSLYKSFWQRNVYNNANKLKTLIFCFQREQLKQKFLFIITWIVLTNLSKKTLLNFELLLKLTNSIIEKTWNLLMKIAKITQK